MRLVVLSTGHDYDGRSTAANALMLSMKGMRAMSESQLHLDGPGKPPATVLTLETGNNFERIYAYADTLRGASGERLVVVGGSDGGVGTSSARREALPTLPSCTMHRAPGARPAACARP